MITDEERALLHEELDRVLDRAPGYSSIAGNSETAFARRRIEAQMFVRQLLRFGQKAAGQTTLRHAVASERGTNLTTAGHMLDLSQVFFGHPDGEPTVADIAFELMAIDAGEVARHIVPRGRTRGLPPNVFRRWQHQLAALCWNARLTALGMDKRDRERAIEDAYGGHPFDTIAGWEGGVRAGLGDFRTDMALRLARMNARDLADGENDILAEALIALREAGAAYQHERGEAAASKRVKGSAEK